MSILLFLVAVLYGVFAWFKPKHAFCIFPFLLPLYVLRANIGPLPTTFLELAFFGVSIGATVKDHAMPWRRGFEGTKPWHIPVLLWIIAALIAVFVAPNHLAALGLWRAYILEPIVFAMLLAGYIETEKDRDDVIRAVVASVVFVTVYALVQFVTGAGIPHPWNTIIQTRRATGPFPFPNALALFCAPISALCAGGLIGPKRPIGRIGPSPRVYALGFIFGLLGVLLAKSVGGFIAVCVAVFLLLLQQAKTRVYAIGAIVIILATIFVTPPLRTRVVSTLSFHEWSGQVRTTIYKETIAMLKDHPIFGAGFGAYPDVIKPYHKATYLEIFQYPHDILLNLWSETGLLGIIAFGWIVVTWARLAKRENFIFLLPLIAILVQGLVDVPYFKNDLAFQFWILAILLSAPPSRHEKAS